jgi:hypothetical protein
LVTILPRLIAPWVHGVDPSQTALYFSSAMVAASVPLLLRLPRLPSAFGTNFGTTKSEIPFTPSGASGVRAKKDGSAGIL